ncbi:hypothetical protein AVEN_175970-1 [Araneus ventricosus]|uniref:Uncharacterized protein n=1 Tax=Araneus ventricosus TaxID=182803 RepID=A0A4Y2X3V3_ARAVE|nr:hypothetical protein AVEN_119613-1 [Araneus ventricosus]GBO43564.1 hypothetical protein AVEN_175970-1 [Araneus ventricosus]
MRCRLIQLRINRGGLLLALGPEGREFQTRFHGRFAAYEGLVHVKFGKRKHPLAGMVRDFGECVAESVVILIIVTIILNSISQN